MEKEEAIKEIKNASDEEVRYGDIEHHYEDVMKRVEAFEMAIEALEQEPCEDYISRQALLKLMGEEPFNWTDSDKELQEVEDYRNFRNIVEQLPSVNPQKIGWIPVSERLPEDSGEYLVSVTDKEDEGYKQVGVAWFAHPKDYDMKDGEWRELMIDEVVIAWMPLPEAYKESEG